MTSLWNKTRAIHWEWDWGVISREKWVFRGTAILRLRRVFCPWICKGPRSTAKCSGELGGGWLRSTSALTWLKILKLPLNHELCLDTTSLSPSPSHFPSYFSKTLLSSFSKDLKIGNHVCKNHYQLFQYIYCKMLKYIPRDV